MTLYETAKRVFKRHGEGMQRYFRCTVGPKKGKLAADPSTCGKRPDPKRVRHGRIVAKTRGSIRVHKTAVAKKTNLSKRIGLLNRRLNNLFNTRDGVKESLSEFIVMNELCSVLVDWADQANILTDELIEEMVEVVYEHSEQLYITDVTDLANTIYTELGYSVEFI